jgi:DNA ligase (NAD+)
LPLRIKAKNISSQIRSTRRSLSMLKEVFKQLNREREDIGEETYANARNTASGTVKMQDSAEVAQKKIRLLPVYYLVRVQITNSVETHSDAIHKLEIVGI